MRSETDAIPAPKRVDKGPRMNVVHPTALIEDDVVVGEGSRIWAHAQVRSGARIGSDCIFGRNTFVDVGVRIGDRVKVQNNASLYEGVTLEDGVFVGPHVVFTNDRIPRAITPGGRLKTTDDWELGCTIVRYGAAIGAGAVIVTGVEIGAWAIVGSGTVVTRDVEPHAVVVGNPGRVIGYVTAGGQRCDNAADALRLTETEKDTET